MASTLNWNEIRARATQFAHDWASDKSERAEAQTFWNEFFHVFGIERRRVAIFEKKVAKLGNREGRIDVFWPGQLLAEHKSAGQDLQAAFEQATDYFHGLDARDLPRYVVVSDFKEIRIVDLEENTDNTFHLKELPKHIKLFGFIAGYQKKTVRAEDPVNVKAAEIMAKLHEAISDVGYSGHQLELFMVRILFCLFADDAGLFEKGIFREYLEDRTREDGSDLGQQLQLIFQILNTSTEKRQSSLDEALQRFPYVNGGLFSESLPIVSFDSAMRATFLTCCNFDWSVISPAVFGSMFQSIMDPEARRNLGAHYTSELNILKVIEPLFLDALYEELDSAGKQRAKLETLQKKLATLRFLDPACGCGNFLVVTYRELRELELEILKRLYPDFSSSAFGTDTLSLLNVDQFYGIEVEEFPARIAEVALWLTDHQMNLKFGEVFGVVPDRLPLVTSAKIVNENALLIDWNEVIPKEKLSYVLGNPPFVGSKMMTEEQRAELLIQFPDVSSAGILDYVTGWYAKAAAYISGTQIEVAFVSTNSITQGEQVGVLWPFLIERFGVVINFAHKTFRWTNDARGRAGVYCIIVGFSTFEHKSKAIYEYESVGGEPHEVSVTHINPYLVDAPDVFIQSRSKPLCDVPEIGIGNKPIDGGNYLFTPEEKEEFLKQEPNAERFMRRWIGAEEFLNGGERWCLWLGEAKPEELKLMPKVLERIENVRVSRLASKSAPTRRLAERPTRFHVENIPKNPYLVIPEVSSERRNYIPIGMIGPEILASNLVKIIPDATLYHFGVLESKMHMTWVRYVCGRLESRYRYSKDIVYNNFPWPKDLSKKQKEEIVDAAQKVLDARDAHPNATLADLYDPNTMPDDLLKAHYQLDRVVDRAYRSAAFTSDSTRISFLFELYSDYSQSK